MQFGLAIAKILPELKATSKGCPPAPEDGPRGLETFLQGRTEKDEHDLEGLYIESKLSSAYEYIRGCTSLRIPSEWKPYVPRAWPEP